MGLGHESHRKPRRIRLDLKERNAIVKEVMKKHNVSLPVASKIVKQQKLWESHKK